MSSDWRYAWQRVYEGSADEPDLQLRAAFSSSGNVLQARIARLKEAWAAAATMAALPENQNVLIGELHRQFQSRFPDIPTKVCVDILRYTLDPRF
jgi:hypothetical protein